jgi:hypothetical protein
VSRYKLSLLGEDLVWRREEDGPLPVRSLGFLRYAPKETPNAELVLEARNGEILLWVEDRKVFTRKKPRGAA